MNVGISYQNDEKNVFKLPYLCITIELFQLFSNLLHYPQIDIQILWNLYIGSSSINAKQYSMLLPNFWKRELHDSTAFIKDSPQLILVSVQ